MLNKPVPYHLDTLALIDLKIQPKNLEQLIKVLLGENQIEQLSLININLQHQHII